MNKPLAFLCSCIAGVGLLLLAHCIYLMVVYGHGNPEAGNFHRSTYSTSRDRVTGKVRRDWDTDWNVVGTTDCPTWADLVDMWFVGIGFVVLGAGIYVAEWSSRGRAYF
jgi:hypothetical protein